MTARTLRPLALGALAVGTLDLLDAFVFFGLRNGTPPSRILQSIAAGLLGRASFSLGDISFMPYFGLLERLGHGDIASSRTNVARWWAEVSSRASWKKVNG